MPCIRIHQSKINLIDKRVIRRKNTGIAWLTTDTASEADKHERQEARAREPRVLQGLRVRGKEGTGCKCLRRLDTPNQSSSHQLTTGPESSVAGAAVGNCGALLPALRPRPALQVGRRLSSCMGRVPNGAASLTPHGSYNNPHTVTLFTTAPTSPWAAPLAPWPRPPSA